MTLTLLVLAMIAAANPFRAASARDDNADRTTVGLALAATLLLVLIAAGVSGPLLELVDVAGPSARIAAGVALLVIALKDIFATPPIPQPALPGWQAGLVPLAFPVIFSPALALLAVAGAAERGVAVALFAAAVALVPAAVALLVGPTEPHRIWTGAVGGFGTAIAALVVLDGVYAI